MKTVAYNPSPLEVDFANALIILQKDIQKHLQGNQIVNIESNINRDNPMVKFSLVDKDGDPTNFDVRRRHVHPDCHPLHCPAHPADHMA